MTASIGQGAEKPGGQRSQGEEGGQEGEGGDRQLQTQGQSGQGGKRAERAYNSIKLPIVQKEEGHAGVNFGCNIVSTMISAVDASNTCMKLFKKK